jgi:predicted amidohydrolase
LIIMRIGIASPPLPPTIASALSWLERLAGEAARQGAAIVCFPESYIPGYPLEGHTVEKGTRETLTAALAKACAIAADHRIALVLPMDWYEGDAFLNVAFVVSATGEVLGYQSKNQLDPSEEALWDAGSGRSTFVVGDLTFGITICHEGFRYPESVRWAARQGAQVVFHPHCTGSDVQGTPFVPEWGHRDNPYYEKAIMMRAMENTSYFASSNYAMRFPESGSCMIAPDGRCVAHAVYGEPGFFVADIDLTAATGLLAKRFKPEKYA